MKAYYQDSAVTIYHGDSREIVPALGKFDLLLTDPPYGIGRDKGGMGQGAQSQRTHYKERWDKERPEDFEHLLASSEKHIIWGGNYFADILPNGKKWLVWDKQQTMPSFSCAELAWTTLAGVAVKMFRYCGAGGTAKEKNRYHPTQKPLALLLWCISKADESGEVRTILDPFAGSGTTGRAAKDLGRKCILIEREEHYCEVSARRMQQEVLAL